MRSVLLTGYENASWKGNLMTLHRLIPLNHMGHARFGYKLSEGRYCGYPYCRLISKELSDAPIVLQDMIWLWYWIICCVWRQVKVKYQEHANNVVLIVFCNSSLISCRAKPLCFWKGLQGILILLKWYLNNGY